MLSSSSRRTSHFLVTTSYVSPHWNYVFASCLCELPPWTRQRGRITQCGLLWLLFSSHAVLRMQLCSIYQYFILHLFYYWMIVHCMMCSISWTGGLSSVGKHLSCFNVLTVMDNNTSLYCLWEQLYCERIWMLSGHAFNIFKYTPKGKILWCHSISVFVIWQRPKCFQSGYAIL